MHISFTVPCLSTEVQAHVHRSLPSNPIIIELGYGVSAQKVYDSIFGRGAASSKIHSENFGCASNYTTALMSRVDVFSDRLLELQDLRDSALMNPKNGFLRLEKERVKKAIRRYKRLSVTKVKAGKEVLRQKRAIGATMAVMAAVVSLLTTISSSVYFAVQIHDLNNYVQDIDAQLQQDAQLSANIAANVRTLRRGDEIVAIKIDAIFESLNRMAKSSACQMTNAFFLNEISAMENYFDELFKSISSHKIDVSLLPLPALVKLINGSSSLQNSLVSTFPSSFYQTSKLSLLSVNKKRRTMRVLLSTPNIQKRAQFVQIAFHSPPVSLKAENGDIYSVSLDLNVNPVALPMEKFMRKGFDVLQLSSDDIDSLTQLLDCSEMSGIPYCRSVAPLEDRQKNCIKGLMLKDSILEQSCQVRRTREKSEKDFSYSVGMTGITITALNRFAVYSYEKNQIGSILAQGGHVGVGATGDLRQCVFAPALFPEILIKDGNNNEYFLTQNPIIRLQTSIGQHREFFAIHRHLAWYNSSSENWTDIHTSNVSEVIRDMKLEEMERHLVSIRRMTAGLNWTTMMIFLLIGWSVVLSVLLGCVCKQQGCSKCCEKDIPQTNVVTTSSADPAAMAIATAAMLQTQDRLVQARLMQQTLEDTPVVPTTNVWARVSNRWRNRNQQNLGHGMSLDTLDSRVTLPSASNISSEEFSVPLRGPATREVNI